MSDFGAGFIRTLLGLAMALLGLMAVGCDSGQGPTDSAPRERQADSGPLDVGGGAEASVPDVGGEAAADAAPDLAPDVAPVDGPVPNGGLPQIHDHSDSPPAHVKALVAAALDGLGFPAGATDGPLPQDKVFVGRYYIAWIDQTGFYGKINGLWRLNGKSGTSLGFALADPDGRPVNALVVGEDGDGRWPAGYPGAEHAEFPNRVPETNDNAACAQGDWCNQYSLNEAAPITDADVPWWSACNPGKPSFTTVFAAVVEQQIAGGLVLVYEGRLVKEADGDGTHDGDACHMDYLFPDGVRRPVYLRVGYELRGDAPYLDRTMQLRNPAGNPELAGAMSIIGGFIMTQWPRPHYLKRLNRFMRPEHSDVFDTTHGVTLKAQQWNPHPYGADSTDEVFGWLGQPFSLSAGSAYLEGRSATLSHVGPSDNDDVGICLCAVHGGIEMGGGLLHANISLPIAGGTSTIVGRRRLELPGTGGAGTVGGFVYEAEGDLQHKTGSAVPGGWAAVPGTDSAEHMAYGPYATNWGGGAAQAVFHMEVDTTSGPNDVVATLDVFDATADQVLVTRQVRRQDFRVAGTYRRFALNLDLSGRAGHAMEARLYWHAAAKLTLDKLTVGTAN